MLKLKGLTTIMILDIIDSFFGNNCHRTKFTADKLIPLSDL